MEKSKRIVKGFSVKRSLAETAEIKSTVYFELKERKETVICNLVIEGLTYGEDLRFVGTAICHSGDIFDLDVGMRVALSAAQRKFENYLERQGDRIFSTLTKITDAVCDMTDQKQNMMIRNKKYRLRPEKRD